MDYWTSVWRGRWNEQSPLVMAESTYTSKDWADKEGRYWTTFFNTLSGARSVVLIGTKNEKGISNLGLFNTLVHLGANPPLMGFIMRPTTVSRDTYNNLIRSGSYTINHVPEALIDQAHQCSAKYKSDESEFTGTGLSEDWMEGVDAPFVKESPIRFSMRFKEEHLIMNGTRLIVGEVESVMIDPEWIEPDGSINITKGNVAAVSGLYRYHSLNYLSTKDFARP